MPASVIERPPSAELRPDQLDEDSLPPYEVLDRILEGYVEHDEGREELVAEGLARDCRRGDRAWSTAPSTSAARPRPGSGSPPRPSAATGACRSPTASARCGRFRARGMTDSPTEIAPAATLTDRESSSSTPIGGRPTTSRSGGSYLLANPLRPGWRRGLPPDHHGGHRERDFKRRRPALSPLAHRRPGPGARSPRPRLS